jgi:hypothetical protein
MLMRLMTLDDGQDLAEFVLVTGLVFVAVVASSRAIATVLVNALINAAASIA